MTKEEKKARKAQKKAEGKGLIAEFKAFISRGNVLDMAVGVIIGGAFNAIVTAFVNILMSVCTWKVPGGIKGLVTVLPAGKNVAQAGMNPELVLEENGAVVASLGQKFDAAYLQGLAEKLAVQTYNVDLADPASATAIESVKGGILGKYTLHGGQYVYNLAAIIDWGTFINAVISFIIIALTLFVIVKTAARMAKVRADIQAKVEAAVEKKEEEAQAE